MTDIFISYGREDEVRVRPVAERLEEHGWTVWWDRRIPAGDTWDEVIDTALQASRCVLVVWSETSIGKRWVREEAEIGLQRGILIPARIDPVEPPIGFRGIHAAELSGWHGEAESPAFRTLITDIEGRIGPPVRPVTAGADAEQAGKPRPQGDVSAAGEPRQEKQRASEERLVEAVPRETPAPRAADPTAPETPAREPAPRKRTSEAVHALTSRPQRPQTPEQTVPGKTKSAGAPGKWIAGAFGLLVVALAAWRILIPSPDIQTASLLVETEPTGAEIWLGDERLGAAPLERTDLEPGERRIVAEIAGFEPSEKVVKLKAGEKSHVILRLTRTQDPPATGSLRVDSRPPGAEWFLDGECRGNTPRVVDRVPAGNHTVEIRKDAFRLWTGEVRVQADEPHEVFATLEPVPPPEKTEYALTVEADPPNATVRILNIRPRYHAGIPLSPGSYHIEVAKPGFHTYREWIDLGRADRVLPVTLEAVVTPATPVSVEREPELRPSVVEREMVRIGAGCFQMGSPETEPARDGDERLHEVCIEKDFFIGRYEVTFEEYDRFCEATGCEAPNDQGWGRGRRPVINVGWHDAMAYAEWLSKETGKRYRLPTEAEWEYAARAGTDTPFHFGKTITPDQANYLGAFTYNGGPKGEFRGRTVPVGEFPANAWGLHAVHGNVWEWTCSAYVKDYSGSETRCVDKHDDGPRVLRGGSWGGEPRRLRSADCDFCWPDGRYGGIGFRLAQD